MNKSILEQLQQALDQAERGGMTRYRIAKNAGISQVILTRLARGTTRPRLDVAENIARAVGYKMSLTKLR